jgi:hypothetical protein
MDQAGKSFGLLKKVSSLESQVSDLMAKIVHLKECDAFLIGIIESACEQLQCKLPRAPECFYCYLWFDISFWLHASQVYVWTPSLKIIRFLNKLQLLRGYLQIPIPFGLMLVTVAPLFFYRTTFSTSKNLLMVVKNLWQPCILLCFPGILLLRILASYSKFSGRAGAFIDL